MRSRSPTRYLWSVRVRTLAFISFLVCAPTATGHAHGRPPYVEAIAFDPSDPDRVIAGFSFGLLLSEDAGASWRWACAAAYGADSTIEDPRFAISDDGSIALATFTGLWRGERDFCTFARATETSGFFVADVARDPHFPGVLWATTSLPPEPDTLQRSTDYGRTWHAFADPISDVLIERIATAPSDPLRLYMSGFVRQTATTPRRGFVLRSDDGGRRFELFEIALDTEERSPEVVLVDPTDADRIFVRVRKGDIAPSPERLLFSDDGGASFEPALIAPQLRAAAISDDGATAWIGSSQGGVWIARDRSAVFTQINDAVVRCLAVRANELWMCTDPYRHAYAIARSIDEGRTIEPVLVLQNVDTLVDCQTCAHTSLVCRSFIDDLAYDFDQYLGTMTLPPPTFLDAGVPRECADAAVLDAGPQRDSGRSDAVRDGGAIAPPAGCACRAARPDRNEGAPFVTAWLALAFVTIALIRVRRSS